MKPSPTTTALPPQADEVRRFEGHTDRVVGVACSESGLLFASCGYDGTVRVWNELLGEQHRFVVPETPGGTGRENRLYRVAFSPNERFLLACGRPRVVPVWHIETEKVYRALPHPSGVTAAVFSADNRAVRTVGTDNVVRQWDLASSQVTGSFRVTSDTAATFSADGRLLAVAEADSSLSLWNCDQGRKVQSFRGHVGAVMGLAISPDGRQLLSGGEDKAVRLWDVRTGEEIHRLQGHTDWVYSVAFSPDGRRALSSSGAVIVDGNFGTSKEKAVRLWELTSGRETHVLKGHGSHVHRVEFVPPLGLRAVSASSDKTVRLWRLPL
jgi:WD40 repeat protein